MMDITHSSLFLTCNYNDSWMQYFLFTYKPVSKLFVTCKRVFISRTFTYWLTITFIRRIAKCL